MANTQETGYIYVAEAASHGPMYGHGFATLFLAEVYGMTPRSDIREKLAKATLADKSLRLGSEIDALISPMNVNDAYEDFWLLTMKSKHAEARARLQALADKGIPLIVPK